MCSTVSFARGLEGGEDLALLDRGVLEQAERARGARRDDDAVERMRGAVGGSHDDSRVRSPQRAHRRPEVHRGPDPLEQRLHVDAAAAADRAPAVPPQAEHRVVAEELDPVGGGELERVPRRRRPERRGHRHEVVPAKRVGVALVAEEAVERLAARVGGAGGAEEPHDLAQEPRAGAPGPPARPLEPAAARDGERHLGRLRRDAELAEQARQVRVVRLVVDDEPGVELERIMRDRVRVASRIRLSLEQLHLVEP